MPAHVVVGCSCCGTMILWWIIFSETPLVSIPIVVVTLSFLKKLFIVLTILGREGAVWWWRRMHTK
jgi:hypothetical protein